MPELQHAQGCPDDSRTERFTVIDPAGAPVPICRCITCGSQQIEVTGIAFEYDAPRAGSASHPAGAPPERVPEPARKPRKDTVSA